MTTALTTRYRYRHRGGTAAEMTVSNPVLEVREIAVEVDTQKIKIGNGVTPWVSLPYANGTGIHRGPTPPSDTGMIWIDTSEL